MPQRAFGLVRHADVDEIEGDTNRQDRKQRAREKDSAPQRGEQHHRSVKSSSAAPPSEIVAGLGSDETPSFQAMTL